MRIVGMGILAVVLATGCAYDVQDDTALGTKHELAGAGAGSGTGGDVVDGKSAVPGSSESATRPGDGKPKPPFPPGDPEPSPWKISVDPTVEPEPSPWGGSGANAPPSTGSDPAHGRKDAKRVPHVFGD